VTMSQMVTEPTIASLGVTKVLHHHVSGLLSDPPDIRPRRCSTYVTPCSFNWVLKLTASRSSTSTITPSCDAYVELKPPIARIQLDGSWVSTEVTSSIIVTSYIDYR